MGRHLPLSRNVGWCSLPLAALLLAVLTLSARPAVAQPAHGLTADDLLLVVNGNSKDSVATAEFYAKARLVPEGRICKLDLPASEEIPFEVYERNVVPTIKRFLRQYKLVDKVRCLVTFYGTPIRIASIKLTPEELKEIGELRIELNSTERRIVAEIGSFEEFAREMVPEFTPNPIPLREVDGMTAAGGGGPSAQLEGLLEQVQRRAELAGRAMYPVINAGDVRKRDQVIARVKSLYAVLSGDAGLVERFSKMELSVPGGVSDKVKQEWEDLEKQVNEAKAVAEASLDRRFDPVERGRLRQVIRQRFGLLTYARILRGQLDYLDADQSYASFDSELTLLWHDWYPRAKWVGNPLFYAAAPYSGRPVLMTARLDGPDEETPRLIVLGSLKAERDGLTGKVVIDSRGLRMNATQPANNAYAEYDQTLRNFHSLVRNKTKLPVVFDEREAVLPPRSVKGAALYCGWYSVGNYVPACTFVPGAVGYHVASFEMLTLKDDKNNGWVKGLLRDGICATTGPVAEPYLFAFPDADEFFPILLTGKFTLAECYYMTQRTLSWQMSLVGDPLYTPFKTRPALAPIDLPLKLQPAVQSALLQRDATGKGPDTTAGGPTSRPLSAPER